MLQSALLDQFDLIKHLQGLLCLSEGDHTENDVTVEAQRPGIGQAPVCRAAQKHAPRLMMLRPDIDLLLLLLEENFDP